MAPSPSTSAPATAAPCSSLTRPRTSTPRLSTTDTRTSAPAATRSGSDEPRAKLGCVATTTRRPAGRPVRRKAPLSSVRKAFDGAGCASTSTGTGGGNGIGPRKMPSSPAGSTPAPPAATPASDDEDAVTAMGVPSADSPDTATSAPLTGCACSSTTRPSMVAPGSSRTSTVCGVLPTRTGRGSDG